MQHEDFSLDNGIRLGDWFQTYPKGIRFWPLDPKPEEIFIEDIACSLSNICRFTGHVKHFLSVGQHSLTVSKLCSHKNALAGLMHDAAEAYVNDVSRPVKPFLNNFKEIEDNILEVIFNKYNIEWPITDEIHMIDRKLCITEARDLDHDITQWGDYEKIITYEFKIEPIGPGESAPLFINRFNKLMEIKNEN